MSGGAELTNTTRPNRSDGANDAFAPPHPTLYALAVLSLWIAILSVPMLSGQFLAAPGINDQYTAGYAFRHWAAEQWHQHGGVPLWNPTLFGGLPFVAAMHGDIFYPTAWLRLFLPTDVAMNIGFVVHYILAGLFVYWLLRLHKTSWAASVVGGLAYQLSGVIASYPSPGHDGKLFVTALLPLGLVALTYAIRRDRLDAYALFALVVGLALLSPQAQMSQYMLIVCGIYTLYMVLVERRDASRSRRLGAVGLSLGAVAVGLGMAMVQYLPFIAYIPFSPRSEEALRGFEWSVSYAIPWIHLPEFFLPDFAGSVQTYWGSNPIKLHSEYLGLSVIGLAVLGALDRSRRRLVYWLGGIGLLFLLISLGGDTPFYRVWWTLVPFVKQTRAPGMAFYVVSLVVAAFAAFGVERVERGEGAKYAPVWLAVGGAVAALGLAGVFGTVAESLARSLQASLGVQRVPAALAGQGDIRLGAVAAGLALLAIGGATWALAKRKMEWPMAGLIIIAIVGTDLWMNARGFWQYTRPRDQLYARDEIIDRLTAEPKPFRVFDEVYGEAALMAHDVSQLAGYHGNQLHTFNQLMANFTRSPFRIWDLYATRFLIFPTGAVDSIPGYEEVLRGISTGEGRTASLYERTEPAPYARLVPAAVKVEDEQALQTIIDPRFSLDRVVLLDPAAPVDPPPLDTLPPPLDVEATFDDWRPGSMSISLSAPAPQDAYVVVAENYYKDWRATVDGEAVPVVRGNTTLITVPVRAGADEIALRFVSEEYRRGKLISLASLAVILAGVIVPAALRRRSGA